MTITDNGSLTAPFPELNWNSDIGHPAALSLHAWAMDNNAPVYPTIEEQIARFRSMSYDGIEVWPSDGCGDLARAREHLERVMDWKRARLAVLANVEPSPTVQTPVPSPTALLQINTLNERIASLERSLRRQQEMHRQDVDIIENRMDEEASNRDWCGEFTRIKKQVNQSLHMKFNNIPDLDYSVSWTEIYTVRLERNYTVTAENEDHAIEVVQQNYQGGNIGDIASELMRAIRNGTYELTETDDFNADECED